MYERQTQFQNNDAAFSVMVRVGTVTAVDNMNLPSGWIPVLINRDFIPDYDVPQKTEKRGGGAGDAAFEQHDHDLIIKPWMPKVNDQVLCLYEPIRDGRGFVLGGIQAWQ